MAKRNSSTILPFPDHINRQDFANFVSGLTAGEGCFYLGLHKARSRGSAIIGTASFRIKMREDDIEIIKLVQSFFRCGHIIHGNHECTGIRHDSECFTVHNINDLLHTVIPHFETYTMHNAKKAKDFHVFSEGVRFMIERRERRPRYHNSVPPRWTDEERNHFGQLVDCLKKQREYRPRYPTTPEPPLATLPPKLVIHETQNGFFFPD